MFVVVFIAVILVDCCCIFAVEICRNHLAHLHVMLKSDATANDRPIAGDSNPLNSLGWSGTCGETTPTTIGNAMLQRTIERSSRTPAADLNLRGDRQALEKHRRHPYSLIDVVLIPRVSN
jgi:hypothetical protein